MIASLGRKLRLGKCLIANDAIQLLGCCTTHVLANFLEQLDLERALGVLDPDDVTLPDFRRCLRGLSIDEDGSDIARFLPLRSAGGE